MSNTQIYLAGLWDDVGNVVSMKMSAVRLYPQANFVFPLGPYEPWVDFDELAHELNDHIEGIIGVPASTKIVTNKLVTLRYSSRKSIEKLIDVLKPYSVLKYDHLTWLEDMFDPDKVLNANVHRPSRPKDSWYGDFGLEQVVRDFTMMESSTFYNWLGGVFDYSAIYAQQRGTNKVLIGMKPAGSLMTDLLHKRLSAEFGDNQVLLTERPQAWTNRTILSFSHEASKMLAERLLPYVRFQENNLALFLSDLSPNVDKLATEPRHQRDAVNYRTSRHWRSQRRPTDDTMIVTFIPASTGVSQEIICDIDTPRIRIIKQLAETWGACRNIQYRYGEAQNV